MVVVMETIDNKQKIFDTALELFSEKGFEGVGVQLLAEKSGITKPTLYYYFGNKEGVFTELLKAHYAKLNDLLEKASVYNSNIESYYEDVHPVLVKVATAYFKFAMNNEKFYKMALSALFLPQTSQAYEIVSSFNNKQYKIIGDMFSKMAKAHHNMKGREKRFCWTFIGMINTYIGLWYNKLETLSEKTTEDVVRQFMHGIFS